MRKIGFGFRSFSLKIFVFLLDTAMKIIYWVYDFYGLSILGVNYLNSGNGRNMIVLDMACFVFLHPPEYEMSGIQSRSFSYIYQSKEKVRYTTRLLP
jgi:hypothetical protein